MQPGSSVQKQVESVGESIHRSEAKPPTDLRNIRDRSYDLVGPALAGKASVQTILLRRLAVASRHRISNGGYALFGKRCSSNWCSALSTGQLRMNRARSRAKALANDAAELC